MTEMKEITQEELQAAIRRQFPNYDQMIKREEERERARKEYIEQEERLAQERYYRYMLLEENITLFFRTEGLYVYDPNGRITSGELYNIYKQWCLAQKIPLHPPREFWLHAKNQAAQYRLVYSTYIPDQNGKRCRGFYGIRALTEEEKNTTPE